MEADLPLGALYIPTANKLIWLTSQEGLLFITGLNQG